MSRYVKGLQMKALEKRLAGASELLVVDTLKLNSKETHTLRVDLRKKGLQLKIVPNKQARLVLKKLGMEPSADLLKGPSAFVFGGTDIVQTARDLVEIAKKQDKMVIKGGVIGATSFDTAGVQTLSKSASRLELVGQIVAMIAGALPSVIATLTGPASQVASQIEEIGKRGGEAPADAAAPAAAEPAPAG